VFLEQTVDHYLAAESIPLQLKTTGGLQDKKLRKKVGEAIDRLVKNGAPKKDFAGIEKGVDDKNSPLMKIVSFSTAATILATKRHAAPTSTTRLA
jgi:hypothetical protein